MSRVLLYHKINTNSVDSQLLKVHPDNFYEQLKWLSDNYSVISLLDLIGLHAVGRISGDEVAITFDDGYSDNLTNMLPIIKELNIPVTVFITTGLINSIGGFWWDKVEQLIHDAPIRSYYLTIGKSYFSIDLKSIKGKIMAIDLICAELKKYPLDVINDNINNLIDVLNINLRRRKTHSIMNEEQLIMLNESELVTIGSHTQSHTRLSILSNLKQKEEIFKSRIYLENLLNINVDLISYPFGNTCDFSPTTEILTKKCGYLAGIANIQDDITIHSRSTAIPRRLVRDWILEDFITWMNDPVASRMEEKSLRSRNAFRKICSL